MKGTILKRKYRRKTGSGLFRTVFVVEVLSNESIADLELADIAHEIIEGGSSGRVQCIEKKQISRQDMAKALISQGRDPAFLHPFGSDDDE